jgi:prepilin-type N-terminal cleavage/methylation domain-containing protein
MSRRDEKKHNDGFSLVELIVVIAIMSVLVGVIAPSFSVYVERSRISLDIQNVDEIVRAANAYITEHPGLSDDEIDGLVANVATDSTWDITVKDCVPNISGYKFKYKGWKSYDVTYKNGRWIVQGCTSKQIGGQYYYLSGAQSTSTVDLTECRNGTF